MAQELDAVTAKVMKKKVIQRFTAAHPNEMHMRDEFGRFIDRLLWYLFDTVDAAKVSQLRHFVDAERNASFRARDARGRPYFIFSLNQQKIITITCEELETAHRGRYNRTRFESLQRVLKILSTRPGGI